MMPLRLFIQKAGLCLGLLVLCTLTDGCVTRAVWAKRSYRPAPEPRLSLTLAPQANDVLVLYDEQRDESEKRRPRAYWLFAYTAARETRPKPEFVAPETPLDAVSIPLLDEATATYSPPASGYYAALVDGQQAFELWKDGRHLGRFYLPVYSLAPQTTAGRVALTPLAVVADVVIVGSACAVVAGVVVGILYLESLPDS